MLSLEIVLGVVHAILRNPDDPLPLGKLADTSGWSACYLQRSFADRVGESPKQFQQRLRLDEAALQLAHTERSVLEIALDTGFGSQEVFGRAFKRRFDCTPSGYRRALRVRLRDDDDGTHRQAELVRRFGPCVGLYRTPLYEQDRNQTMATSEVTQIELEARPILYIQRRVPQAEFQQLFGECFPLLYGHCMQHGYAMAGNPMARYVDFGPGMATVDCIIPLQASAEGADEIQAGELQAGTTAFATHTGPYDSLHLTYGTVEQWIEDQGLERNGPHWEWYVTDPGEVPDPNDWKTEVYFPVKA